MDNQFTPEPFSDDPDDLEALIRETRLEIDALNEHAPELEATPDAPVPDVFDDYFDRHFEAEPNDPAAPLPEEASPTESSVKKKRPNFFQRRWNRRLRKRKDSAALSIFGNIIYFALVAAAAISIAKFAWLCADDVLALTKQDSLASVTIAEGDNLNKISQKLYDAGLINYPWLFNFYGKYSHVEDKVTPGVYELNTLYDYHALVNGMGGTYNRMTTTVTIIEGKTVRDIFQTLEDAGVCSVKSLNEAASEANFDFDFLAGLPTGTPQRLEGYLFPDTYEFYLADDAENVINKFLTNFDGRLDEAIMEKVHASGYSLQEVLALASIIQEEAAAPEEDATIASVIFNRLASDSLQRLQMDSTVYYAAELLGTDFDTNLDSPYNTYKYPGIPAGPIDNPGLAAIQAVLNPEDTDYYYFAYGKDGVSHFYSDWDSFEAFLASDEYVG